MSKPIAEVCFGCGRAYFSICDIAVAMEGDACRDGDMPNEIYPEIPAFDMEHGSIGGQSIKGMDPKLIRVFRGDKWTVKMLQYVADKVNEAVNEH